ncbi:Pre-rRNA-processing protein ipi3 [Rhizina undulata]
MLSEQVLLSTSRSPATESHSTAGDASIAIYNLHTYSQTTTFKRSTTAKNCLAVTDSHIFAAQSDKAVVNVYSREKGNLECSVPFSERFTVLEASPCGGFIACGTESGRLAVWEVASGRYISTPQIHLQKVTCIAFDSTSNFIITGSADSNVYVWSLVSLLELRNNDRKPERILDRHQREITAVATGRASSGGPTDIVVTASRDLSCSVWDYHTGTHLRTYVFSAVPTSLALDPVDRAFYAGFEDGTVQCVDFHKPTSRDGSQPSSENQLFAEEYRDIPVTLSSNRWYASGHESPILCMGVGYEGNYLVTGSEKGDVCIWDIATGHLFRNLAQLKAPVTSLKILRPSGFTPKCDGQPLSGTSQITIPKPRYDAILASASANMADPHEYTLSTKFSSPLSEVRTSPLIDRTSNLTSSEFSPSADMDAISKGAAKMRAFKPSLASKHKTEALESELATLYEQYDRLARLHQKTWDSHAKWLLEANNQIQGNAGSSS